MGEAGLPKGEGGRSGLVMVQMPSGRVCINVIEDGGLRGEALLFHKVAFYYCALSCVWALSDGICEKFNCWFISAFQGY